ncbi:hypothetical protein CEQ31_006225 [Serratia odorifera]|uniref:Uncharacterized protein n=1 Tax=Serratia odorifera DSM 4582 TaxID=667129 RepID=D4EAB8_SEROD|nr:hypothetical protein HMPREF0758_5118 [Serratia odorifera DSM 4582]PNK89324.1 hypothetical protein CEQ31_006225 [Serratia odorifera]RII70430.1 hypothetical protein DX901_20075 [Serratia odorifera]
MLESGEVKPAEPVAGNDQFAVVVIQGLKAQKDPEALAAAKATLQQEGKPATAAIQGLAGGNMVQALSGAAAPYLAEHLLVRTQELLFKLNY